MRQPALLFPVLAFLFFVSGATALLYQVVWLRSLVLIFGSTAFAVSTVLTAFMAGLAAGSYLVGRFADRTRSPVRLYGLLEVAIGAYALVVPGLFASLEPLYRWVWATGPTPYAFVLLRFVLCLAVLILPTMMMGGTLPALAAFGSRLPRDIAGSLGTLYGVNTVGAFVGTMLTGFVLLPRLGLSATVLAAAGVNVIIGATALVISTPRLTRNAASIQTGPEEIDAPRSKRVAGPAAVERRALVGAFAATGAAALMLEVAWTRVLTLILGPSVYAFSIMLATFLAGLGLGSLLLAWAIPRFGLTGLRPFYVLSGVAGLLAFGTLLALNRLPYLYTALFRMLSAGENAPEPGALHAMALLISAMVMLPATIAMGGLFPAVIRGLRLERDAAGRTVGIVYAANSGGAIAGAFLAGFVVIPAVGLQNTMVVAIAVYMLAMATIAWHAHRDDIERRWHLPAAAAAFILLIPWVTPSWNKVLMMSGVYHYADEQGDARSARAFAGRLDSAYVERFYAEGLVASVLVVEERDARFLLGSRSVPSLLLINNGKIDASSVADMPTQILSAHIPVLLHAAPARVLVVGLASGTTAGSVLRHDIEQLDIVEIEAAIVEASHEFDRVNGTPLDDSRTRVIVADGRTHLLLGDDRYDVIISEPSNPWMTGVSNLFTLEFFELARRRLNHGGVFAQWIQTYGMSPENVATLLRTFHEVFPHAFVFNTITRTDLIIVGSVEPPSITPARLQLRLATDPVQRDLARVGIHDVADLLARGRMGTKEVQALVAGDVLLNTDDNAWIEFTAPLDLHRETREDNERQIAAHALGIIDYLTFESGPEDQADFRRRLTAAYESLGFGDEAVHTRQASARSRR